MLKQSIFWQFPNDLNLRVTSLGRMLFFLNLIWPNLLVLNLFIPNCVKAQYFYEQGQLSDRREYTIPPKDKGQQHNLENRTP